MKFLFDFFPILVFFSVFKWSKDHLNTAQNITVQYLSKIVSNNDIIDTSQVPILLATAITILVMLVQMVYLLLRCKKIDSTFLLSLITIILFGGATIYFHDDSFIKWKPTVLYWCFSIILLTSKFILKKNLICIMMEKQIRLSEQIWNQLNLAWSVFFILLGLLNLYIAFNYTINTWVNFKLFGIIILILVFVCIQSIYLYKHIKDMQ